MWLSRAIRSSSLYPSGSPSGSPGQHGQRHPAHTGHAPSLARPGPAESHPRWTWLPAFTSPPGARSGGRPLPHVAAASGDVNGRGRCEITPERVKMSEAHKARILPAADSLNSLSVYPTLRFAIWFWTSDVRHQAHTCCSTASLSTAQGFQSQYSLLETQRVTAHRSERQVLDHLAADETRLQRRPHVSQKRSACSCSTRSINDGCVCQARNRVRAFSTQRNRRSMKLSNSTKLSTLRGLSSSHGNAAPAAGGRNVRFALVFAWPGGPAWDFSLSVLMGGGF